MVSGSKMKSENNYLSLLEKKRETNVHEIYPCLGYGVGIAAWSRAHCLMFSGTRTAKWIEKKKRDKNSPRMLNTKHVTSSKSLEARSSLLS